MKPDVVSYTLAIDACGEAGEWERACVLLDKMRHDGVEPDHLCYGAAIHACGRAGKHERAVDMLRDMEKVSLR